MSGTATAAAVVDVSKAALQGWSREELCRHWGATVCRLSPTKSGVAHLQKTAEDDTSSVAWSCFWSNAGEDRLEHEQLLPASPLKPEQHQL